MSKTTQQDDGSHRANTEALYSMLCDRFRGRQEWSRAEREAAKRLAARSGGSVTDVEAEEDESLVA